jgi:hypothetical protein
MGKKTDSHWGMILLICCFLFFPVCSGAQKNAFVRTEINPADAWYTGQRIGFYITLYSKTQFTGVPRFELPSVSGLILMEIEDRPVLGRVNEQGLEFLSKSHEFAVFAQRAGGFLIPAFTVSFACMDPITNQAVAVTHKTEALKIHVIRPPGSDGIEPIISTREFKVEAVWDPKPETPRVGDAFKRIITRTAEDIPGMVFAPVRPQKINGLGVYETPPLVEDRMERGNFTGKRREIITYVCEQEGRYEIGEIVFHWFDIEKKQSKTERIAPFVLNVSPNPQYIKPDRVLGNKEDRSGGGAVTVGWVVAGIGIVGLGLFWLKKPMALGYRVWKQRRAESERFFFKMFEDACRSDTDEKVLQALFVWMNRLESDPPAGSRSFCSIQACFARYHDPDLLAVFTALERQAFGDTEKKKHADPELSARLLAPVRQYRKDYLKGHVPRTKANRLAPLNP